jgi:hypothetical protein
LTFQLDFVQLTHGQKKTRSKKAKASDKKAGAKQERKSTATIDHENSAANQNLEPSAWQVGDLTSSESYASSWRGMECGPRLRARWFAGDVGVVTDIAGPCQVRPKCSVASAI